MDYLFLFTYPAIDFPIIALYDYCLAVAVVIGAGPVFQEARGLKPH